MDKVQYPVGDMIFAAEDIYNDGGMPGIEDEEGLIVAAGTRGVVVHFGVAEMDETREIYLVQFENGPDGSLGPPVGCLPEELTQNVAPQGHALSSAVDA